MKHEPFLYRWTELSTGKWYIGSRTAKICHPEDGYLCSSKIVKPRILANPEDWKREILCMGEAEYIRDLEIHYLHALDAMRDPTSYNQSNGTNGRVLGLKSPETKAKISAAKKGMKLGPPSQEHRANLSAAAKGRPKSPEARANMSATRKGRPSPNKGKTASPETRAKMSAAAKSRNKANKKAPRKVL